MPSMRWLTALVHLIGFAAMAILAYRSFDYAMGSFEYNDVTNMMRIPKYPFQFAIAISAGLFSLVLLIDGLKAFRRPAAGPGEPE